MLEKFYGKVQIVMQVVGEGEAVPNGEAQGRPTHQSLLLQQDYQMITGYVLDIKKKQQLEVMP